MPIRNKFEILLAVESHYIFKNNLFFFPFCINLFPIRYQNDLTNNKKYVIYNDAISETERKIFCKLLEIMLICWHPILYWVSVD